MKKGLDLGPFPSNHANFFLDIMPMTDLFFQDKISFDSCKVIGSVIAELVTENFCFKLQVRPLHSVPVFSISMDNRGGSIRSFWEGEQTLYVGHHGWPTNKILDFRWSKKDKVMLEAIYKFFGKMFLSIFPNFPHFYIQWKLAYEIFSIFQNLQTHWWGKRKNTHVAVSEKRKTEKS